MGRIEIKGLSKSYGGVPALAELDLVVEDGEFVTLLGPSGCGKTTTLNLLAGFLEPDVGTIEIDGRVVSSPGHRVEPESRGMGMVFQSYALWPHKSVYANVAYGLQRKKLPRAEVRTRVDAMLELVGLAGFDQRYPDQLSGGQQQRVALARSLITEPAILLLDEPLSNLDAKLRESMRYEVQRIQRRTATTFVYVTHDQVEAMSMSDRVAVLEGGRLRQYAPPREIYLAPANAFVADFMGLVNFVPGTVVGSTNGSGACTVRLGIDDSCVIQAQLPIGSSYLSEGDAVAVALRPEIFGLHDADAAANGPQVHGTVKQSVVLGNIIHYFVAVGDALVRVQTDHTVDIDIGTRVAMSISQDYARAFPMSEAEQLMRKRQTMEPQEG